MIEIQGVGAKNVVYFKEAYATLNENPITFVRGQNLDADPATPTGNGSGKSLFFGLIPTVAYASPPTSKKKKAKKEILSKASAIKFDLKGADGHQYSIVQSSTKYTIHKDGEDIKIRTTPLAEAYIREHIFPLSEIEYYTHGFISTLRPYLLRDDTDANRLEHFSSIFRLNNYDELRGHFSKQVRSIKDNEIRLSVLEQKSLTLKEKLAKVRKRVTKGDLSKAREQHKQLSAEIQKEVEEEFNLVKMQETLRTLLTIEKELDELRSKYVYKDHPSKRLAILKEQKSLVKKWESYNSLLKAYSKNIKATQERLDALKLPKTKRKELEVELAQLKEQIEKLEAKIESAEEARDEYERLVKKAKPLNAELVELGVRKGDKVDLKADYNPEIDSLRTQLRLKNLLNHDHLDGNSCPTCMSEIDIKNIKKLVSDAKDKLPVLEAKQRAQELFKEIKQLREKISKIEFNADDFAKLEKRKDSLESDAEKVREAVKVWKRYDELKSVLADIEKPKAPKEESDTNLTYDELDEHIDLCTEILSHVASKTKLLERNPELSEFKSVKNVKAKVEEVKAEIEKLSESLTARRKLLAGISEGIEKQAAYKSEFDLYTSELTDITAEIAELKPSLEDKKILDVLLKAYSSKGLKVIVANDICSRLEENLNFYRHLIFAEPFSFSVSASDTGLSIRVDRGNDKESDVRNLSGAESNCFNLLFLISILPLIPEHRRLNMVILDEPSAHMDKVSQQIFVERYLPALMEVVPHVYIITPNDEYLNGSREWIVRKSGGVATLITNPHMDISAIQEIASAAVAKAKGSAKKAPATKTKRKSKATA